MRATYKDTSALLAHACFFLKTIYCYCTLAVRRTVFPKLLQQNIIANLLTAIKNSSSNNDHIVEALLPLALERASNRHLISNKQNVLVFYHKHTDRLMD